ncbi:hypothetical protein BN381_140038 [Candidatus Microthrix parvicella RN1]|uniref:Uncharacterized protein n=1 Tax=Candidatus Neomicrothrix parvicella RN1 TaxID=1229780 RepID=R4YXE8_9ACTN|nr:hypothetical protein BN381_140038 [Candidatus Microthrix parvicella RN1]
MSDHSNHCRHQRFAGLGGWHPLLDQQPCRSVRLQRDHPARQLRASEIKTDQVRRSGQQASAHHSNGTRPPQPDTPGMPGRSRSVEGDATQTLSSRGRRRLIGLIVDGVIPTALTRSALTRSALASTVFLSIAPPSAKRGRHLLGPRAHPGDGILEVARIGHHVLGGVEQAPHRVDRLQRSVLKRLRCILERIGHGFSVWVGRGPILSGI